MSGRRRRAPLRDEDGSILPLLLGYALLVVAVLFVCACATDLYVAQKRLDALADAAALAGADGFVLVEDDDGARVALTEAGVREQATALLLAALPGDAIVIEATTTDGVTARVTVGGEWHPPLVSLFVPDGVALQAIATSRTALR